MLRTTKKQIINVFWKLLELCMTKILISVVQGALIWCWLGWGSLCCCWKYILNIKKQLPNQSLNCMDFHRVMWFSLPCQCCVGAPVLHDYESYHWYDINECKAGAIWGGSNLGWTFSGKFPCLSILKIWCINVVSRVLMKLMFIIDNTPF